MRRRELVDSEHTLSGFRELVERGRPHRAEADDEGVVLHSGYVLTQIIAFTSGSVPSQDYALIDFGE